MANAHVHRPFEVNEGARGKEKVIGGSGVALPRYHGESPGLDLFVILFLNSANAWFSP